MIGVAVLAVLIGSVVAIVTATGSSRGPRDATATSADRHQRVPGDLALAASYLGISRSQLRRELRPGVTLAEVASGTGGRSATGLTDALVTARSARLRAAVAAGTLSRSRLAVRITRLRAHVRAEIDRPRPPHRSLHP
jgi:hypothetical protein